MNDFQRTELEDLKARVDLAELMRQAGLELKPVGKNLLARCPWHDDTEASLVVNPAKQLYNCFGCEAKGDVLSFLQVQEKLSFPEAVTRLRELAGVAEVASESEARPRGRDHLSGGLTRPELLKRVAEHYQQGLAQSEEAREYLKGRGLGSVEMWRSFGLGYCGGTLLKAVPKGSPTREAMTELGVLNSKGKEHFLGCVVVPLEHPELGLVGLYGRRLNPNAKVRHLFLPGPKRGLLNWRVLRTSEVLYLVEGALDALSLWVSGVRNVSCLHGTGGLTADLDQFLKRSSVTEVRLCLDSDRAGEEAIDKVCEQLAGRFRVSRVLLPAGVDPNALLVKEGADVLRSFLNCAQPLSELETQDPSEDLEPPLTETTDSGFTLEFSDVLYQVTPRPPFTGRLQVALRASLRDTADRRRFLDRVDLTSSRARSALVKAMSHQLNISRERIEAQVFNLVETVEDWVQAFDEDGPEMTDKQVPEMTASQKAAALDFLQSPNLVERILGDMEEFGYVGESKGKLLAYLIGLSRKLENPLSGIIRSQSGAGKSGLSSLVARLTPPEEVVHYSRVSAQALAYAPKDAFKRKLVVMEERVGGEAADYYIRILQSSHRIRQAVVIKDPSTGKMRTQEFEVEGPIAYLETTTSRYLNQENASRCFEIYLDETEDQTQRIHARQRDSRSLMRLKRSERESILERHHNAQRMLDEVQVVIPYVHQLTFPTRWLRTRRDNERFLCLIEASAFLHQHQRVRKTVRGPRGDIEYVEATLADYELAYELAKDVLRDTLHELSISARELLDKARTLEGSFTRRHLREALGWPQRRVTENVAELVDMEYLAVLSGSNGKAYEYTVVLADGEQPSPIHGLVHPTALRTALCTAGADSG